VTRLIRNRIDNPRIICFLMVQYFIEALPRYRLFKRNLNLVGDKKRKAAFFVAASDGEL
jgi:hypothetical protein